MHGFGPSGRKLLLVSAPLRIPPPAPRYARKIGWTSVGGAGPGQSLPICWRWRPPKLAPPKHGNFCVQISVELRLDIGGGRDIGALRPVRHDGLVRHISVLAWQVGGTVPRPMGGGGGDGGGVWNGGRGDTRCRGV